MGTRSQDQGRHPPQQPPLVSKGTEAEAGSHENWEKETEALDVIAKVVYSSRLPARCSRFLPNGISRVLLV